MFHEVMTASIKIRRSFFLLSFLFLGLVFLLGLFYLNQVNGLATKGYEIKEREDWLNCLKAENQKLKIELAGARRLDCLSEFAESQNLVKIERASFLSAPGELVARK